MSSLHLKKNSALSSVKEIAQFINPDIVVIPIAVAQDTNFKVIVEKGDYVYKGQEIATRSGFLKTPIISSVSGTIKNIIKVDTPTLKQVDAFEIENDLKERTLRLHAFDFNSLSREKFVEILRTCAINGMGGAGFPTYIKYDLEKQAKCLLVNAVECETYITADQELLKSKTKTIIKEIKKI